MNTSKAIWIKHPKHVITTLHSYTYEGKDNLCVMFTLPEKGEMTLSTANEKDAKSRLLLLHTPNDYLLFSETGIKGKMFSLDIDIPLSIERKIVFKKDNEKLEFYSANKCILTLSNPAFLGSASFGVISEGTGKTYIEIF